MRELAKNATIWLLAHAVHGFVIFCIVMGALYQFINGKNIEGLPTSKRFFSQLTAVLVVGIGAVYFIEVRKWDIYLVSMLGVIGGMMADKVLRMGLTLMEDSTSFVDFFNRFSRAARAGWKAYNEMRGKGETDENHE